MKPPPLHLVRAFFAGGITSELSRAERIAAVRGAIIAHYVSAPLYVYSAFLSAAVVLCFRGPKTARSFVSEVFARSRESIKRDRVNLAALSPSPERRPS